VTRLQIERESNNIIVHHCTVNGDGHVHFLVDGELKIIQNTITIFAKKYFPRVEN